MIFPRCDFAAVKEMSGEMLYYRCHRLNLNGQQQEVSFLRFKSPFPLVLSFFFALSALLLFSCRGIYLSGCGKQHTDPINFKTILLFNKIRLIEDFLGDTTRNKQSFNE